VHVLAKAGINGVYSNELLPDQVKPTLQRAGGGEGGGGALARECFVQL
jgi:hypothetical protein